MRRHWALAALLACATPLLLAFAWQGSLASVSDDSASYLALAQAISGANPAVLPWVGYHTHFPPLFPLALALTGGASDFLVAHVVVALFSALGVGLVYAFAWRESGRRDASLLLAAAFLLCPTTWVSAKGILSEPMFLCVSLATLLFYRARIDPHGGATRDWIVLGFLLAATILTRVVGATLVAALFAHLALRSRRREPLPRIGQLAAALAIPALLVLAWIAVRPVADADSYQRVSTAMVQSWSGNTGVMSHVSGTIALYGWVASFTADAGVGPGALTAVALVALLALAGLVRRLVLNRLDAWYVAVSLVVVVWWVFNEDNTRRLLFPLLPMLLYYAGEAVVLACRRLGHAAYARQALGVALVVMAIATLPALVLFAGKALDRDPVVPGHAPRYSDITEYYTTLNVGFSRTLAARQAVMLAGFEALREATPPGAKVLWMRPEYAAIIAHRDGVPWYYDWDPARVARVVRDQRVDYILVTQLFKTDLAGQKGDPSKPLAEVIAYAKPVLALANPVGGTTDFILLQVDHAALEARLARSGP